jgi:predicted ATP-grasp superfamily ATP-dependent carboligase
MDPTVAVEVRALKNARLAGGTLIVSVPEFGPASVLLADHLLAVHKMTHIAALDSMALPPIAMVRSGLACAPMRIHADEGQKLALLWSEVAPPAPMARLIARAVVGWAKEQRIARILVLEQAARNPSREGPKAGVDGAVPDVAEDARAQRRRAGPGGLSYVVSNDAARAEAERTGAHELDGAVLGGLAAAILVEGRHQEASVVGLFVEVDRPEAIMEAPLVFADALKKLLPHILVNRQGLRDRVSEVQSTIRTVQRQVAETLDHMKDKQTESAPSMYG